MSASLPPQRAEAVLGNGGNESAASPASSSNDLLSRQSSRESPEACEKSGDQSVNPAPPAMDEIDQLGNRLEKFVSSAANESPPPKAAVTVLPSPRKHSAGSQIPRPEISPKPAYLASIASASRNLMTQSMRVSSKTKSPPNQAAESKVSSTTTATTANGKTAGTASILKSTLRRMTRLSINTTTATSAARDKSSESTKGSPEDRKSAARGRRQSPSSSTNSVSRSKSFKEPADAPSRSANGGIIPRNMPLSSSLRRPKNKDREDIPGRSGFQRAGTGGTLDRRSVGRSHSTAGGGSRRHLKDVQIKKSRAVQTQLTRDAINDDDVGDAPVPTSVDFSLHMPDLLGAEVDPVETHVVEPSEPVDVRKNRQLTLDNMRLQREVERLKGQMSDGEALKKELRSVRSKLEEEQRMRVRIEGELDRHNEKVRMIAQSMDCVEQQFETRDNNIQSLERRLEDSNAAALRLQAEVDVSHDVVGNIKAELDRSVAQQRQLLKQCQEAEMESKELQEFLQAEKMTLSETLKVI